MTRSLFGLEGKRIIVLGGGLGMGEATCTLLAELGCNVAVLDIIPERAERVAGLCEAKGVRSLPIIADVLDDAQLIAAMARAEHDLGPLDGMATIVGAADMISSVDASMESWDLEHRRNLRYIFLAAQELARSLLGRGAPGSIASVASVDGLRASTNHSAYGAAKAGLISLSKSLSGEWARHGIRFNVVAPGGVVTPRRPLASEESELATMGLVPMPYRGQVEDIARALVFFLSDMARYVTGQALAVDGGYTAVGPIDYYRYATRNR
jgi:NAD(P)-dependent dehydrogenase (short-subunit alcohol dehydrogenase family)